MKCQKWLPTAQCGLSQTEPTRRTDHLPACRRGRHESGDAVFRGCRRDHRSVCRRVATLFHFRETVDRQDLCPQPSYGRSEGMSRAAGGPHLLPIHKQGKLKLRGCPISRGFRDVGPVHVSSRIHQRTPRGKISYFGLGPTFANPGQTWATPRLKIERSFPESRFPPRCGAPGNPSSGT
jgi:hypothetical protein